VSREVDTSGDEKVAAVLSLVAHELREPLAVIRGYVSMLREGVLDASMRDEALRVIDSKTQEADTLVETILLPARMEAESFGRETSEFDVSESVAQAVASVATHAKHEQATISVRTPPEPVPVLADPDHVCRVLVNLLHNALSYSRGSTEVEVAVRVGNPVEIAVSDRGTGIEPDNRERIFQPFERVGDAPSPFTRGLGLGLSISRRLAELNGGSLVLERSTPNCGSVFVLRVPTAPNGTGPPHDA
jgi:two-component system sensor histidine kinase KdpD